MIYPPTVFANIPIDRILVHQQRLVNRAAKEMDRFIDQDDWSEETLLVLTLRLASVLVSVVTINQLRTHGWI